jgi:hypothetical protein
MLTRLAWLCLGTWLGGTVIHRADLMAAVAILTGVLFAGHVLREKWKKGRRVAIVQSLLIFMVGIGLATASPWLIPLEVLSYKQIYVGLQRQAEFHYSGPVAPCEKAGLVHRLYTGATLHTLANREVHIELAIGNEAKSFTLEHARIFVESTVPEIFIQDEYWRTTTPTNIMTTLRGPVNSTDCLKVDPLKVKFPHAGTFHLEFSMSGSRMEAFAVPIVVSVP